MTVDSCSLTTYNVTERDERQSSCQLRHSQQYVVRRCSFVSCRLSYKIGGCAPLGEAGSPSNTMSPGPMSTSLPSASRSIQLFGHDRHGPKIGGAVPLWGWRGCSASNAMWPGSMPTSVQSGILIMQPFGHNRHGRKIGGHDRFLCGGAGSPCNTMWPEPRPTSMPSFVLIQPTVWPQYTNITDRMNRAGRCTSSIGRTVLQAVTQKRSYVYA